MERRLLVAAAVGGLLATPALAADLLNYPAAPPPADSPIYAPTSMVTADIGMAIAYIDLDSYDSGEFVGNGRVNIPFGAGWNEEIEVGGLTEFVSGGYDAIGAFSHTYYKNPQYAAGFVLGGSSLGGDGVFTAGVEGAAFMPSASLVGLLAYNWGSGGTPDFWVASGEARWYWNPNTKLSGTATYSDWNSAWMLVAAAEHRFDGTQFSLFGSGTYYTNDTGDGYELLAGGRWFFDRPGRTLQGHDYEIPFAAARAVSY